MSFIIKKASKKAKKLRILFSASSGSGKTMSSLLCAYGLVGDWNKICVIDTERESSTIYSDIGDTEFNVIPLNAPYTPERYIEAIKTAEKNRLMYNFLFKIIFILIMYAKYQLLQI